MDNKDKVFTLGKDKIYYGVCDGLGKHYDIGTMPIRFLTIMLWGLAPLPVLIVYWLLAYHMKDSDVNSDV